MSDEKWSRPAQPPGPLFTGKKERDFVKHINDEINERVIGQQILYYPIDIRTTNFDELYGEAPIKNFLPPVECKALVEWQGSSTTYESSIGIEKMVKITARFQKRRVSLEKEIYVKVGDFILYGGVYFEIVKVDEPDELFGQQDQKFAIFAECVRARQGAFRAV